MFLLGSYCTFMKVRFELIKARRLQLRNVFY